MSTPAAAVGGSIRRVPSRFSLKRTVQDKTEEQELDPDVAYFKDEIEDYERLTDKWLRRGRRIVKRYKDIRSPREEAVTRFNVFWANVCIRMPALYARNPKAQIERRFRDRDPVGRVASEILERSVQFHLDSVNDAKLINRQAILDYELVGRGTTWLRYVPHFQHQPAQKKAEPTQADDQGPTVDNADESTGPTLGGASTVREDPAHQARDELAAQGPQTTSNADSEADEDQIQHEEVKLDYVAWEDFGHCWARTWDEVRAVWRKVYLDRDELRERFKGEGMLTEAQILRIPLDYSPKTLQDARIPLTRKKAVVYEIWDKKWRQLLWYVRGCPFFLDRREDPEQLKDFFPCPRPLLANLANDDLVPVPNFIHYQDQANEVDELSSRITSITKSLKVAGVRDTSAEGLDRLLAEGVENQLVPVEGWAVHKEKGGLKGVYELLPMAEIAETLGYMRDQRQQLIDDIYQLTGISDIVRGLSDPSETATAQQLKGQFSVLRIQDAQEEVQRFCRDQVHIMGEMIAKFDIGTIKAISGVKLLTAEEKQQIQIQLHQQALTDQLARQRGSAQPTAGQPVPGAPSGAGPGTTGPPGAPSPQMPGSPQGGAAAPPVAGPQTHPMAPGPPTPGNIPGQGAPMGGGMNPAAPSNPMTPAPGQAPISPDKLQLLELPTWEEIEALLRNPVVREFRLDIETDSTIRMDEEQEKASRMELLKAVAEYMQQAMTAGQMAPEIIPMLAELLMFGIRAFTTARSVEQTFEDMMHAIEEAAKQPRGPPPEVQKAQMEAQAKVQVAQQTSQIELQARQQQLQAETQQKAQENQMEAQREQHRIQMEGQLDQFKAQLKAHTEMLMKQHEHHFEAQREQFKAGHEHHMAILQHHLDRGLQQQQQSHETRRDMLGNASAERQARAKGNGKQKVA
jgi:hypothetical protein